MDINELEQKEQEITVGNKIIKAHGQFIGNIFCVNRRSIDEHPSLTQREYYRAIIQ